MSKKNKRLNFIVKKVGDSDGITLHEVLMDYINEKNYKESKEKLRNEFVVVITNNMNLFEEKEEHQWTLSEEGRKYYDKRKFGYNWLKEEIENNLKKKEERDRNNIKQLFKRTSQRYDQKIEIDLSNDKRVLNCFEHFKQRVKERTGSSISFEHYMEEWVKNIRGRYVVVSKNKMLRLLGNYHKDINLAVIVYINLKYGENHIYVPLTFYLLNDQHRKFNKYNLSIINKDKDPILQKK